MRSVAKHSYIKGKSGKAKAKAHVNYIQHRSGPDKDGKPRSFFDGERNEIKGGEVKREIEAMPYSPVVVHKFMLSPGLQGVDMREYTRYVMSEIEKEKGLDLEWKAVVHKNTQHDHAHVVVMGLDQNDSRVRFDKRDYTKIREAGDRYLERNHYYERFLDKEIQGLLKEPDYRLRGDDDFNKLVGELHAAREGEKEKAVEKDAQDRQKVKERERDPFQDDDEWRRLNDNFKDYLRDIDRTTDLYGKGYFRRIKEHQGRLAAEHGHYQSAMELKRIEDLAERFPDRKEELTQLAEEVRKFDREQWRDSKGFESLDKLLGDDQNVAKNIEKVKEPAAGKVDSSQQSFINQIVQKELEKPMDREEEIDRDDGSRSKDNN